MQGEPQITLSATGKDIEISNIVIKAWRPAIFLGMNATLKSMTARSLIWEKPNLRDLGISVSIKIDGEEINENICESRAECLYIEDVRMILRAGVSRLAEIEGILGNIEYFVSESVREEAVSTPLMESVRRLREIIYGGLFGIVSRYCDCIGRHDDDVYTQLRNVLNNVKSEIEAKLRKIETSKVRDVSIDNVLPINVNINCKEFRERRGIKIDVRDYRLWKEISVEHVSSAIAAITTLKLIMCFLSMLTDKQFKILVVEEPEEAMSPPQQVLFMMFIRKALDEVKRLVPDKPIFIVITTHSPYITTSVSDVDTYYFYFDRERKIFTAISAPPTRPFIYAEAFQPLIVEEEASSS